MNLTLSHNRVLVVAAHPDDEVLGCGATIARHVDQGDQVSVLILSHGVSSRNLEKNRLHEEVEVRKQALKTACTTLGVSDHVQFDFPDNAFDTVPLIDIAQTIEKVIQQAKPSIVYTHFSGDLNIDHQLTHRAVMTACRPQPQSAIKQLYSFEVLSATNYISASMQPFFNPNYYVDISSYMEKKMAALEAYHIEMRPFPHTRSYEGVRALAAYRGSSVGREAAEAFMVERIIQ